MFDFIRKRFLWRVLDAGYQRELDQKISYQLKWAQDLAIYDVLRDRRNLRIAEIGGGDSRVLRSLAERNECFNIEKFEGRNAGPVAEVSIPGVSNIIAFVGDFDDSVPTEYFDVAFSISVVEHVGTEALQDFHCDVLRMLRSGGLFLHAIDMYVGDESDDRVEKRFESYKNMVVGDDRVRPLGDVVDCMPRFECTMVSNPDNILHGWNLYASQLSELRQRTQSVSLLVGGLKR